MTFFESITDLCFTRFAFGFFASLLVHANARCAWESLPRDPATIFTYFFGTYFSIHVFSWFGVYTYLYHSVIAVALDYLVKSFDLSNKSGTSIIFFSELFFGYWAAGDVLGGWCDLERIAICIQDETSTVFKEMDICESYIINGFTRFVQAICERLSSSYNEEEDVYVRKESGVCIYVFRYMGHLIMTLLSFFFTYHVIF